MPERIEIALLASGLGMVATLLCLIDTTPITMTLFFAVGIPLFVAGFLLYALAVLKDLRGHRVL